MNSWANKFVLVLGLGETGLSMVHWLALQGARLRAADSRDTPQGLDEVAQYIPAEEIVCGAFTDALFEDIDLIAISPGVPLSDPCIATALARGIPVLGDIELFAQHCSDIAGFKPQDETKVVAITGSNGKTTVTSMVEHLCKVCGRDAVAAGNISPAILDVVLQRGDRQPEIWVLELSSFQLETTSNLQLDAATVLNVCEDHLDRYEGMDGYTTAKSRIFNRTRLQVLNRDDVRSIGMKCATGRYISFGLNSPPRAEDFGIERAGDEIWLVHGADRLLNASELKLVGLHNVSNALAALALCHSINLPMICLLDGLRSFKGLPHRVALVGEINGVTFYDDSKGTNVGATVSALAGLGCRAVLIAGGTGKGQDFTKLKTAVSRHARAVVLIGRDAALIEAAILGCGVAVIHAKDMQEAVQQAMKQALPGDAVLLSPACASFDMYRNYAHRAQVFIDEFGHLTNEATRDSQVQEAKWPL